MEEVEEGTRRVERAGNVGGHVGLGPHKRGESEGRRSGMVLF